MSDSPEMEELNAPTIDSMAAFSNQLQELTDSLNVLYIRNNASGRNKFREKWPDVAWFIFGEELIKCDNEGTNDRDRRSELEESASERRIQLKGTIAEFIGKSVDKGALQFDYVGSIVDLYGAAITRFLYAEDVIERVRPGVLANLVTAQDLEDAKKAKEEAKRDADFARKVAEDKGEPVPQEYQMPAEDQKLSAEEQSILSNAPAPSAEHLSDDVLDNVKPIEVERPSDEKRQLHDPMSEVPSDEVVSPSGSDIESVPQNVSPNVEGALDKQMASDDNIIQKNDIPAPSEVADPIAQAEKLEEQSALQETAADKSDDSLSSPQIADPLDSVQPIDTGNISEDRLPVNTEISQQSKPVADGTNNDDAVSTSVHENVVSEPPKSVEQPVQESAPIAPPTEEDLTPVVEAKVEEKPAQVTENIAPSDPITPVEEGKPSSPEPEPVEEAAPVMPPPPPSSPEELATSPMSEPKVDDVPDVKVAKGTYVALFNAVAPIV
ncbi:MAG: hypothetical protein ACRBB3_06410 [Alphaproteobacteria bacterium]